MRKRTGILGVLVIAGATSLAAQAGSAEGRMVVNGNERILKFARAAEVPDESDSHKLETHVTISDVAISRKAAADDMSLFDLSSSGKLHGIEIVFKDGGVVWMLRSMDSKGMSYSQSHSPNPYPITVADGKVAGEFKATEKSDGLTIEIAVKFATPIEKFVPEAAPTAADEVAAKSSAAAKAYLTLSAAIAKGDRAGIKAAAASEYAAAIDGPDFPQMLKALQGMQYKDVIVRKATEADGEATLWVTGRSPEGKAQKGQINMAQEGGKWVMRGESWKD